MIERRQLTHEDVRRLVMGSIELVCEAQLQLNLPICPNILDTRDSLKDGEFFADSLLNLRECRYGMDYGCFSPPHTIMLDKNLPFSDRPLNMPELASTISLYSAVHEVIHTDDFVGGDELHKATLEHMLQDHRDKLDTAMEFIQSEEGNECIKTVTELANLSAGHYVDMVTHYRSFVSLRYADAPKLDMIWDKLAPTYFPPNLLTQIEAESGMEYVFDRFTKRRGHYCLIEAFDEINEMDNRKASSYTV